MKDTLIYTAALAVLMLASCTSEKAPQALVKASSTTAPVTNRASHLSAASITHEPTAPAKLMTKDGLPKDLVCMVNNAYMGKKQFPVAFEDKMYYGCCKMCVNTIKSQREVRYATDPVTGEKVDKSLAFITLKPGSANGEVLYFASEENYQKYQR